MAEIILITLGADASAMKTAAQQAARSLVSAGIKVRENIVLCTETAQLQQSISTALGRSNILLTIGGMGPDSSYLCKRIMCAGLGVTLEHNADAQRGIRGYCNRTGEPSLPSDEDLAALPKGCKVFSGTHGKLPGCALSAGKQHIIMLPELPQEILPMCGRYVVPFLTGAEATTAVTRTVRTYGISEEKVREMLAKQLATPNPAVTVQRDGSETLVRVMASADLPSRAAAMCTPVLRSIVEILGDFAYGLDVDSLQAAVVTKMNKKLLDLAVAESGSAGMLTRVIAETDGGQDILRYSLNADDDKIKTEKLGIPAKQLKKRGAVSEHTAVAMAAGVREKAHTSIGVAICAADEHSGKKIPAGLVYIAVCDDNNVYVKKLMVDGADKDLITDAALSRALNMLRLFVDYSPAKYPGAIPLWEALDGKTVTDKDSYEEVAADASAPATAQPEDAPEKPTGFFGRIKENFTIKKTDRPGTKVKKFVFMLAVLVFLGSAGYLGYYYVDSYLNMTLSRNLQNMFAFGDMQGVTVSPDFPRQYNSKFGGLWTLNNDIVAFVQVPETNVKYPVVQSVDNDHYLRRDFYEKSNQYGVPFMDYRVDVKRPSENMVIYGHNMRDGTIFGELLGYRELDFYRAHPVIDLSTLYGDEQYKIFSIFITNAYESQGPIFKYHDFINAKRDGSLTRFAEQVRIRSLIETTVDVNEDDELLTLSTCTYEFKDARFVIVARKLRRGEDAAVDVDSARKSPNPLMPDIWYKNFGGTKPNTGDDTQIVTSTTAEPPSSSSSTSAVPLSSSSSSSSARSSSVDTAASEKAASEKAASDAENSRLTSEAEQSRAASRSEQLRQESEAERSQRSAAEESRLASEAEQSRIASEAEQSRLASEAEQSRLASEAEEASRRAEEELEAANMSTRNGLTLDIYSGGARKSVDAQDAVARIVQSEIGANYSTEAIKAQAVAAYTFIAQSNAAGTTPEVYLADRADAKVEKAVSAVIGEAIYYNNRLAFTPYHATSAGMTTSSENVWGGKYSYLVPVDSQVDENAGNYRYSVTMTRSKVEGLIESKLGIQPDGDPSDWINIIDRDEGGYITRASICGHEKSVKSGAKITGRSLREGVFSLRSANFDVHYDSGRDNFVFTTYGYGHGVGMSQTGANLYAKDGWSYIDILEHYYPGTTVR